MNDIFIPAISLSSLDGRTGKELLEQFNFISVDSYNVKSKSIHNLNHINCFVGVNNSGKSRLLRSILSAIKSRQQSTNTQYGKSLENEAIENFHRLLSHNNIQTEHSIYINIILQLKNKCVNDFIKIFANLSTLKQKQVAKNNIYTSYQLMEEIINTGFVKNDTLSPSQKEEYFAMFDSMDFYKHIEYITIRKGDYKKIHDEVKKLSAQISNDKIKTQIKTQIKTLIYRVLYDFGWRAVRVG